mmetsp:Transcript_47526/g.146849  ORF Transcript_47526/g.146849 Transcript_47526/m.146849 type:complete len:183 (+) Transcript_47526:3-551(+)
MFYAGWDPETRKARRSNINDEKKKEYCITVKETKDPQGFPEARWSDGATWSVSTITNAECRQLTASRQSGGESECLWEGSHIISHHRVQFKKKPDRGMLVVITEQGKHIFQVKAKVFNSIADAGVFTQRIAEQYCENKIEKCGLQAARNLAPKSMDKPEDAVFYEEVKKRRVAAGVGDGEAK